MYYYPVSLPEKINKDKLQGIKVSNYKTCMLYSSEGIFQIKKGRIYRVHYTDDCSSKKITIGKTKYVCDRSETKWTESHKIPYKFVRKELAVTCYEVGSVKMYIEECKEKVSHIYFYVSESNIYGVENDIQELMRKVLKASF